MSIGPIEAIGPLFTPLAVPTATAPTAPTGAGREFGSMVLDGIERLEGLQDTADTLAVRAASGNLPNIHDYTLAATEAEVATKLTVAVRNKAIESFTEIMRMQVG
jgi:flagellar hook-basal body complex protein FliE